MEIQDQGRGGEENSRLTILKVESYKKKEIVIHVYVHGLKLKNPARPGGISTDIGHLPFAKVAVLNGVTELEMENGVLPEFKEGYENWKAAFKSGKGGVFTIGVSEAVDYVEKAINQ